MTIRYKGARYRPASKSRPQSTREIELPNTEDVPGLINGRQAGSSYEWNIARALWTLLWTFEYQVPFFGGRDVRGGVVLDFLVNTRPAQTGINPIGEYWHKDVSADQVEDIRILKRLGRGSRMLRPGTDECATYDAALKYIFKNIGKG